MQACGVSGLGVGDLCFGAGVCADPTFGNCVLARRRRLRDELEHPRTDRGDVAAADVDIPRARAARRLQERRAAAVYRVVELAPGATNPPTPAPRPRGSKKKGSSDDALPPYAIALIVLLALCCCLACVGAAASARARGKKRSAWSLGPRAWERSSTLETIPENFAERGEAGERVAACGGRVAAEGDKGAERKWSTFESADETVPRPGSVELGEVDDEKRVRSLRARQGEEKTEATGAAALGALAAVAAVEVVTPRSAESSPRTPGRTRGRAELFFSGKSYVGRRRLHGLSASRPRRSPRFIKGRAARRTRAP